MSLFGSLDNNTVFRENMQALEKYRPLQFRLVLRWFEENGEPNLQVVRSGRFDWVRGKDFSFPANGEYLLQGSAATSVWLLIVLGFGLGEGLHALRTRFPKSPRIVVFEPDMEIFITALAYQDQKVLLSDGRFALVLGRVPVEVSSQFREATSVSTLALAGALGVVAHAGATEIFRDEYRKNIEEVKSSIDMFFRNLGNSVEDTLLGVKQFAVNTLNIACTVSLDKLKDLFKGRPGIVVSAGPGLDKAIHLLPQVKGKLVVICNDVVLPKLLDRGIVPDIVCSLERGLLVYEQWFSKIHERTSDIVLIAPAVVSPEIFGTFRGPKFVVAKTGLPLDGRLADLFAMDKMHMGSSVAHTCFNIGHLLGCDPIILVGQDLAYGEGGLTHSSDVTGTTTQEVAAMYKNNVDILEVPGALGGMVKTNPWWLMFLRQLEALIANCPAKVIDASEGGALKHGAEVMNFEKAIETYLPEEEFAPLVSQLQPTTPFIAQSRMEQLQEKAKLLEENLDVSLRYFDEIEAVVERVLAPALSSKKRLSLAESIGEKLDSLRLEHPDVFQMVQSYIFSMVVECTGRDFDFADPEFRARWARLHREFTATSRVAVAFLKDYVSWMRDTAEIGARIFQGEEILPALAKALAMKRDWNVPREQIPLEEYWNATLQSLECGSRAFFEEPRHLFPEWWEQLESPMALHVVGKAFLRWKQLELAVPVLKKAAELEPDNPEIWIDLGYAYADYDVLRDFEITKGMEAYYRALALDPKNDRAREQLRSLARRVVDLYGSALEAEDALGIGDYIRRSMHLNMADCYGVLEEYEKAAFLYEQEFKIDTPDSWDDPERLIHFVLCLEKTGRRSEALEWADLLVRTMEKKDHFYPYALWNVLSFFARNNVWDRYLRLEKRMRMGSILIDYAQRHRAMVEQEIGPIEKQITSQVVEGESR